MGEFPIDNNLAERIIRKLTTQRNSSFHCGNDAGAEMAATYHSVIGTFFKKIFNVWRDHVNMIPDKITLGTS